MLDLEALLQEWEGVRFPQSRVLNRDVVLLKTSSLKEPVELPEPLCVGGGKGLRANN